MNLGGVNEYSRFGAAFATLNRAAYLYFSGYLEPYGLRPGQQGYLLVVEPDEEVNQEEIARRHNVDKANAARAVVALERLGYLRRRRAPHDRRNWLVSLTPQGERVRAHVERHMRDWISSLKDAIDSGTWSVVLSAVEAMAHRADEVAGGGAAPGVTPAHRSDEPPEEATACGGLPNQPGDDADALSHGAVQ